MEAARIASIWSLNRPKGSLRYAFLLLLAGLFIVSRQQASLVVGGPLSATEPETQQKRTRMFPSFVLPDHPHLRYAKHGNMTAAEKVAAEYNNNHGGATPDPLEYDPLSTCSVTSQVRVIQAKPEWILQSIDSQGNQKTVGGDEFYVTYQDSRVKASDDPTAVAFVQDLEDGTYALDFCTTPGNLTPTYLNGEGILTVHFQYSCGIGNAHQPLKNKWLMGGATLVSHSRPAVSQPPMREFQRPGSVDLTPFDLVVSFGDSLMQNLVCRGTGKKKVFHRPKTEWRKNPQAGLNNSTLGKFLQSLEEWHGTALRDNSNTALILGSAVWDISPWNAPGRSGDGFQDHLVTCRVFVNIVARTYPNVTLFWRAPSAMHIHRLKVNKCKSQEGCSRSVRYISNSRAKYLHGQQLIIMQELGIPVLDTYNATFLSANLHSPSDTIHYKASFDKILLNYFYSD